MAAMRQSLWGTIYVFILLPRMKDGAEVLKQRDIQEGKELEEIKHDIDELEEQLEQKSVKNMIIEMIQKRIGVLDPYKIKQLDILMKMDTEKMENRDRDLMNEPTPSYSQRQYDDKCAELLSNENLRVDKHDIDILMICIVRKHRKKTGD
jgi:hypothetical protein